MSESIALRGLVVTCVVGVHEWERGAPRELLLDLVLDVDLDAAIDADDVACTVDYDAVARAVRARIASMAPRLIETVAAAAADVCLADPRVAAVEATVHKPGAVAGCADVSVTVRRGRS